MGAIFERCFVVHNFYRLIVFKLSALDNILWREGNLLYCYFLVDITSLCIIGNVK